ncbi:hypothetical protein ODJ79_11535 [Actinoplanes sp. KI2]|nr:hypothetical protein [Actinoplanes sp. KI2]MCU7724349.1 hypothetical protein [Actinoplanes sp. KI2]
MRERAEILGGTLIVTPGGPGTTVRLHVPQIMTAADDAPADSPPRR